MKDKYEEFIFNHYGLNSQLKKLREECLELVEVIDSGRMQEGHIDVRVLLTEDPFDAGKILEHDLIDEMADVYLLINQIVAGAEFNQKFAEYYQFKKLRQVHRINEASKEMIDHH